MIKGTGSSLLSCESRFKWNCFLFNIIALFSQVKSDVITAWTERSLGWRYSLSTFTTTFRPKAKRSNSSGEKRHPSTLWTFSCLDSFALALKDDPPVSVACLRKFLIYSQGFGRYANEPENSVICRKTVLTPQLQKALSKPGRVSSAGFWESALLSAVFWK